MCTLYSFLQRYFVLHHYGGVYLDLDIGCKRPLDPLLNFEVILPHTIPIGISNDLIFSSPRHPFMELTIHNLITFDHTYGTNYPTVMFSTGPMFLSAQYNLWPSNDGDHGGVRVLPKSLYGKNAPPEETEAAFFWHYYGSSWHANDAGFIRLVRLGLLLCPCIFLLADHRSAGWQLWHVPPLPGLRSCLSWLPPHVVAKAQDGLWQVCWPHFPALHSFFKRVPQRILHSRTFKTYLPSALPCQSPPRPSGLQSAWHLFVQRRRWQALLGPHVLVIVDRQQFGQGVW